MTPTMSTWCSNQLSYNPKHGYYSIIAFRKMQALFFHSITIKEFIIKCEGEDHR